MENQKSSILFNILTIVGLIIWAVCFFFGINYTNNGAWVASMSLAIFLLVVTYALVTVMRKASKENDQKNRNLKILAIALYCVSVAVSAVYVVHFIDITLNHQNEIQDEALSEINEIYDYIDCQDNPNPRSYMYWVGQELDSYARQLRAQDLSESTIETRVAELESQLVDQSGFSEMVSEAEDFLGHCHYSVDNWIWLTVPKYLGQLSQKKPQYEQQLERFALSTDFTREDSTPYKCASTHNDSTMVERVSAPSLASWTIIPIVLILVLQAMILLSYFKERPATASNPSKAKGNWGRSYNPGKKTNPNADFASNFPAQHAKESRDAASYTDNNGNNGNHYQNGNGNYGSNSGDSSDNGSSDNPEVTLM